jgi:PQQ-like domain
MLRIRLGQRWKQEGASEALDAFGLELDGVALLPPASEEPLVMVMEQVLSATAALVRGQAVVEISLPESAQELLLVREGEELVLRAFRLARPAGEARRPVRLDLEGWQRGVVRAGRAWLEDLRATHAPVRVRQRARALLARAEREPRAARALAPGFGLRLEPEALPGFRLEGADPGGLLDGAGAELGVPLGPLAVPGTLSLLAAGVARCELRGPLGVLALELLRQAEDTVHALEAGERAWLLAPAGVPPAWEVDVALAQVRGPGWALTWSAEQLVRALVAPGLALASLLGALDPGLADNAHLVDFTVRGRSVLAALRGLVARPSAEPVATPHRPPRAAPPLHRRAKVRRLGFVRRLKAAGLGGEGAALVLPLAKGFALLGRSQAVFVGAEGRVGRRWTAARGIAVTPGGEALLAEKTRWLHVRLDEAEARWVRDQEGVTLEGQLLTSGSELLATTEGEGVRALVRLTGRELWRFAPQRVRRLHLALHGRRVLVASESGALHGLDAAEGTVRFRIAADLPFLGPPVAWGRAAVAVLGSAARSAVLVVDAQSGDVRWVRELALPLLGRALPRGATVRVLGFREGVPVLLSLGTGGATRWERQLPPGPGPWTLAADGDASLVVAADGSAVRVDGRGRIDWRLGAQPVRSPAAPVLRRGVLLVAGDTVRAVDVHSGRVVAELEGMGGIHALSATSALDVAVLDAAGDLGVWKLGASLGVVEG